MASYSISFPISKCQEWTALRGTFNNKQVLIWRWNNQYIDFLHFQLLQLEQWKRQTSNLPNIVQINSQTDYTDLIIDNCSQWILGNQLEMSTTFALIIEIYYIYKVFHDERDFMLENIIKNNDSIVVLDFGLKYHKFKDYINQSLKIKLQHYSIYWCPLLLINKLSPQPQWSLGILILALIHGSSKIREFENQFKQSLLNNGELMQIENILAFFSIKSTQLRQFLGELLDYNNPINWNDISENQIFKNNAKCINIIMQQQRSLENQLFMGSNIKKFINQNSEPNLVMSSMKLSQIVPKRKNMHSHTNSQHQQSSASINRNLIMKNSMYYESHKKKIALTLSQKKFSQSPQCLKVTLSNNQKSFYQKSTKYETLFNKQSQQEINIQKSNIPMQNRKMKMVAQQKFKNYQNQKSERRQLSQGNKDKEISISDNTSDYQQDQKQTQTNTPEDFILKQVNSQKKLQNENDEKLSQKDLATQQSFITYQQEQQDKQDQKQQTEEKTEKTNFSCQEIKTIKNLSPIKQFNFEEEQLDDLQIYGINNPQAFSKEHSFQVQENNQEQVKQVKEQSIVQEKVINGQFIQKDELQKSENKQENPREQDQGYTSPIKRRNLRGPQDQPLKDNEIKLFSGKSSMELIQDKQDKVQSQKNVENKEERKESGRKKSILKKKSYIPQNIRLSDYKKDYKYAFECLNLVGTSVVKCLEFLSGLQNFWIIPLFLVFKRMLQLRTLGLQKMKKGENSFDYPDWDKIITSMEFMKYMEELKSENDIVSGELVSLLNIAKKRAEKLEAQRRKKVEWFLNEDLNQDIGDTCLIYLYSQIYDNIKKQIKQKGMKAIKVAIQVQGAIIVCQQDLFDYPEYIMDLENLNHVLSVDDEEALKQYLNHNESIVDEHLNKLKQKGIKIIKT